MPHSISATALALLSASLALALAQNPTFSPTTVRGSQSIFAPQPTNNPVGCNPATAGGATQGFTVNYNYETVERGVPNLSITNIGVYNLLDFNLVWLNTDGDTDGNHLGIAPHSYPDVAAFSLNTALLTKKPSITANYTESTISHFDADSWWYGCVYPTEESLGSLPKTCDITATGLDAAGKQIAKQTFHFAANGSVVQNQNFGRFQGFKGVYTINLEVSDALATAALVDNFIATVYQPTCAPYY